MANRVKGVLFSWRLTAGSLVWLALFSQTPLFATWYGSAMPVVTPLTVASVEHVEVDGNPGARLSGFATINRQCDYAGLDWYYSGETRRIKIKAFFQDPVQVRGDGQNRWEALIVGIPPEELDQTEGYVRHRCGMVPVTSPFFDSKHSLRDVELRHETDTQR